MHSPWAELKAQGTAGKQAVNLEEVRRAMEVLACPDYGIEIMGLTQGLGTNSRFCHGNDANEICSAVWDLADYNFIYFRVNPVPTSLRRAAKHPDIISRWWLFIDVDAKRFSTKVSATDAEHEAARRAIEGISVFLKELDWPAPVMIDSGNGWYLLYRVEMTNDDASQEVIKSFLKALADKFDGPQWEVDRKVHDAGRLAKVPGTWAMKGENTPERPHRMAKLIEVPEGFSRPLWAGHIEKATEALRRAPQKAEPVILPMPSPFDMRVSNDVERKLAYVEKAIRDEVAAVVSAPEGGRNDRLNIAAFNLGTFVGGGVASRLDIESRLCGAGTAAGLESSEIPRTIKSGIEAGIKKPRGVPESNGQPSVNGNAANGTSPDPQSDEIIIIRASQITPRKVEWLWPDRIPLAKLTTFAGVTGLGKTFTLCDVAARVSRGLGWPDTPKVPANPGQVLFVSGEDDFDDTIVPRLISLGADLERIVFLKSHIQDRFTLADLKTLEKALSQAGPDVRFIAIDPPTAFLGGVDDHKNAELRGLLSPLKSWAAKYRVAIVFNTHVNKGTGVKVEAVARVIGSVAWVNAVRAAHMFTKNPDDCDQSLFIPMKMNIGPKRKGLAFKLAILPDDQARLEWLGEVDTTADDAINAASKSRKVVASEWLIALFRESLEWESEEMWSKAATDGISKNAIYEAKNVLQLPPCRKNTNQNGSTTWIWWVPPDWKFFKKAQQTATPSAAVPVNADSENF